MEKNVAGVCGIYSSDYLYQESENISKKKPIDYTEEKDIVEEDSLVLDEPYVEESTDEEPAEEVVTEEHAEEDINEIESIEDEYEEEKSDEIESAENEVKDEVKTTSTKAKIRNVTDGNEFKSMAEADRYYGFTSGTVSSAIKSDSEIEGMKFEKI